MSRASGYHASFLFGRSGFKPRTGDRLSWQVFRDFLITYRQMLEWHLKLGHGRFFLHSFQFIVIMSFDALAYYRRCWQNRQINCEYKQINILEQGFSIFSRLCCSIFSPLLIHSRAAGLHMSTIFNAVECHKQDHILRNIFSTKSVSNKTDTAFTCDGAPLNHESILDAKYRRAWAASQ
jgi:hypothetical protein